MTYAHVGAEGIDPEKGSRLPPSARRLDNGNWVLGLPNASVAAQRACGWFEVVDVERPADTATHTHDRSLALVGGIPTVTWTQRAWTAGELDARQRDANRIAIDAAIATAITKLDQLIAAPALSTIPTGTLSTAQLATALRTLRDQTQATRAGAQDVALILKQTIKLVRGDYASVS